MNIKTFTTLLIIVIIAALLIGGVVIFNNGSRKENNENINYEINKNQDEPVAKIIALGSSLSRASNASTSMQGENNEYSFSTGTKINSVYIFLKNRDKNLTFVNLAEPGANMQDVLDRQLPEALRLNPKYITIDPAADIVSKNSVSEYRKYLTQIVDRINPKTTIMIFTYPDFAKMRATSLASCSENKIGVKLENLSRENVLLFNQAIKDVSKNKSNVILIDIYDLLGPNDISDYDCLHINLEGQEKISTEFVKILNSEGGE